MRLTEIVGPSYWAAYFINDDPTYLDDEEQDQADRWLKREKVRIIDIKDDEEPWFTWDMNQYAPELGCEGGEVVTYDAELLE